MRNPAVFRAGKVLIGPEAFLQAYWEQSLSPSRNQTNLIVHFLLPTTHGEPIDQRLGTAPGFLAARPGLAGYAALICHTVYPHHHGKWVSTVFKL